MSFYRFFGVFLVISVVWATSAHAASVLSASARGFGSRMATVQPTSAAGGRTERAIARVIRTALRGRAGRDDLSIRIECQTDEGYRSATVFGNGVAIWGEERQVIISPDAMQIVLQALERNQFATMKETYGGRTKPDPRLRRRRRVLKVICSVGLTAGGIAKEVQQLAGGAQSPELKRLAVTVLNTVEKTSKTGVTAESLTDGLGKIAQGGLAPETLQITVNRAAGPSAGTSSGALLRIDGRWVEAEVRSSSGAVRSHRLVLTESELRELASSLAEHGVAQLPENLYAEHYTDLVVRVLNHLKTIQARQFADLRSDTHGEEQRRFDRLLEQLEQLRQRVSRAER